MGLNKKLYTFENLTTKFTPTQYSSIANNMQYIAAHSCVGLTSVICITTVTQVSLYYITQAVNLAL